MTDQTPIDATPVIAGETIDPATLAELRASITAQIRDEMAKAAADAAKPVKIVRDPAAPANVVQAGETLADVATLLGVDPVDLYIANQAAIGSDVRNVYPGLVLVVPAADGAPA